MTALRLQETALFRGLTEEELEAALRALHATERGYARDEIILSAGSAAERMGLVLAGGVRIESNDAWGNRTLLSHVGAGQFFAESYALLPAEPMLVDVVANEDCRVLFLRIASLLDEPEAAPWRSRLLGNLLRIAARKNLHFAARSFHTAPRKIRSRVLAYLNTVSLQQGAAGFDIPFDRQQLADYLNVERTALSKELGRMQADGVITVRKNHFVIHRGQE